MRRRKNTIKSVERPDGSVINDQAEMAALTNDFYKKMFRSEGTTSMDTVLNFVPVKVTHAMNEGITAPNTGDEVKTALFQMFPTKAPGPDGYPAHFFQRH